MDQNIYVVEPASELRRSAREALRGKWKDASVGVGLYMALAAIPAFILVMIFAPEEAVQTSIEGLDYSAIYPYNNFEFSDFIANIYTIIISGPLMLGYITFLMAIYRKKEHNMGMVLSGFNHFGKSLGLYLLMNLYVVLWSLLFVIPGIIAAYRYSMAFYILADDPTVGINEAITRSKYMMVGNKFKLFCLGLSYIGWMLLLAFVFSAIIVPFSFVINAAPLIGGLLLVIAIVVVGAPLTAYIEVGMISFYEIVSGRRKQNTISGNFTVSDGFQNDGSESYSAGDMKLAQEQKPLEEPEQNKSQPSEQGQSESLADSSESGSAERYNPFEDKTEKKETGEE